MLTSLRLRSILAAVPVAAALLASCAAVAKPPPAEVDSAGVPDRVQLGPRPAWLVQDMEASPLKSQLESCANKPSRRSDFSIGHRGAALQFPEHTRESYMAAASMGAGIVECDVTFTKDRELVCRHSQCDLHTTTNILAIPELAAKCSVPFQPADPVTGTPATAQCCTSDITLEEFKTLKGKMDASDPAATTVEQYMKGTPDWRTDLYAGNGTLMTLSESIDLFESLGVKHTPELKSPSVAMPYEGDYTQRDYAQAMIDAYKAAGVPSSRVWPQSFRLDDVLYWIQKEPEFGVQAVYLDDIDTPDEAPSLERLKTLAAHGVKIIAPPLFALLSLDQDNLIVASEYAKNAKAAGLDIIAWTLERSGPLQSGGGWYYQSVSDAIDDDGDTYVALDVLAKEVGVLGVFSDWPATTTYYANCMGM